MMDYDAILSQVVALLERERRIAYRVLKRRLQLDDDLLEDLKDDLIYAKKLARDEAGKVLVWAGTPVDASSLSSSPSPESHPPDAERRQLTVLFCDLVDLTALAMQGQGAEGMAQSRQGIAACRAIGNVLYVPYFCTVLADI